jgi:hypothetical protein
MGDEGAVFGEEVGEAQPSFVVQAAQIRQVWI